MKVFAAAALLLVFSTMSAMGSGPYQPSGWRPRGPAFYLPSEVLNSVQTTTEVIQESEGASSNFLREYGPPKVQDINSEVLKKNIDEEVTDDATVETQTVLKANPVNLEEKESSALTDGLSPVNANTDTGAAGDVNNIAEAIVKVENEATQEVENAQGTSAVKSSNGSSGLPTGFLEYGLPGFREYGVPKENFVEDTSTVNDEDTKEARRRRFSPKFKTTRRQRTHKNH